MEREEAPFLHSPLLAKMISTSPTVLNHLFSSPPLLSCLFCLLTLTPPALAPGLQIKTVAEYYLEDSIISPEGCTPEKTGLRH